MLTRLLKTLSLGVLVAITGLAISFFQFAQEFEEGLGLALLSTYGPDGFNIFTGRASKIIPRWPAAIDKLFRGVVEIHELFKYFYETEISICEKP